jgi:thiamine-monophosphate kinase
MPGEFDFIKRIREQTAKQTKTGLILGIGDDAAILSHQIGWAGRETLITVDLMVEEIDFKIVYAPPRWLGHKALAVSLSDIAAMGGQPRFSLLTLGIPRSDQRSAISDQQFWEEFFAGYFALAEKHGVALIGGDISATPAQLTIDSFVLGDCAAGRALRRSGAQIGDAIYLTGSVGASAAGLKLLLEGARVNEAEGSLLQRALRAQLRPTPPISFGKLIGESGLAHAAIDVSDGLTQDLAHLCEESGVAAMIDYDSIPIAVEVGLVEQEPTAAFNFAVSGGEDFELLLTADGAAGSESRQMAESSAASLTHIGEIVVRESAQDLVFLRLQKDIKPLPPRGFEHFRV